MRFAKYHGLGNDYAVVEPPGEDELSRLAQSSPPAGSLEPLAALAVKVCHRNYGLGSDGLLVGPSAAEGAFGLRIFNPDGSEAEKSGNGLRIFARYLWDTGRARQNAFQVFTKGGLAPVQIGPEAAWIEVGMGQPKFSSEAVGFSGPDRAILGETLKFGEHLLPAVLVSVGNPHCVVLGGRASRERALTLGPLIENDPAFANRTNVQFLEILDRRRIRIEIWERGAGYTLASGSSATAAACAAHRLGHCDDSIEVRMPGGVLHVTIGPDGVARQRGPVSPVATGTLADELIHGPLPPVVA